MSHYSRIAKNTFYLYFRLLVVMAVSLYTVRVVVNALGFVDYGIYGVAAANVAIFTFISGALSQASQRFLSIDIANEDPVALSKTFSSIVILHFAVAVFVVFLTETLGLWFFNNVLNIPDSRVAAANIAYQFSVASSVVVILQMPYIALIVAREQLWFFSFVGVLEALLKLAGAYIVLNIASDKLELYGALMFLSAVMLFFLYFIYSRIKLKEAKLLPHFEWAVYRQLAGFMGWSFIGNAAVAGRNQGVNLLLNVFYGPLVNAAYGIMMQVLNAVNSFTNSLQTAISPQIYKSYGKGDFARLFSLTAIGSKASFMLLLLLVAPITFGLEFLLFTWLGAVPEYTVNFVRGILIVLLIDAASLPLIAALASTGKIKWYQITVGGALLMNVPLCYMGFVITNKPESFLAIAVFVSTTALILRLIFLKRLISFSISNYVKNVVLRIVALGTSVYTVILSFQAVTGAPSSLFSFSSGATIVLIMTVILSISIGLSAHERKWLFGKIFRRGRK